MNPQFPLNIAIIATIFAKIKDLPQIFGRFQKTNKNNGLRNHPKIWGKNNLLT